MPARKSAIDRAIEQLEGDIEMLEFALAKMKLVKTAQQGKTPRKPRIVKPASEQSA